MKSCEKGKAEGTRLPLFFAWETDHASRSALSLCREADEMSRCPPTMIES